MTLATRNEEMSRIQDAAEVALHELLTDIGEENALRVAGWVERNYKKATFTWLCKSLINFAKERN